MCGVFRAGFVGGWMALAGMTLAGSAFGEGSPAVGNGWAACSETLRGEVRAILTFPAEKEELAPEVHRTIPCDGYVIDCVSFASEPGSRVTASLYVPAARNGRVPGIVVGCGHGGSKSSLAYQYAGQLYATMGFACLILDTIGEEERNAEGKMGTRAEPD